MKLNIQSVSYVSQRPVGGIDIIIYKKFADKGKDKKEILNYKLKMSPQIMEGS